MYSEVNPRSFAHSRCRPCQNDSAHPSSKHHHNYAPRKTMNVEKRKIKKRTQHLAPILRRWFLRHRLPMRDPRPQRRDRDGRIGSTPRLRSMLPLMIGVVAVARQEVNAVCVRVG